MNWDDDLRRRLSDRAEAVALYKASLDNFNTLEDQLSAVQSELTELKQSYLNKTVEIADLSRDLERSKRAWHILHESAQTDAATFKSQIELLKAGIEAQKQLLREYQENPYVLGEEHDKKVKAGVYQRCAVICQSRAESYRKLAVSTTYRPDFSSRAESLEEEFLSRAEALEQTAKHILREARSTVRCDYGGNHSQSECNCDPYDTGAPQ